MSQKKVDQYKQEKANRQQLIKKAKAKRALQSFLIVAVLVALVAWFSVSVVRNRMQQSETAGTTIDVTAVEDFMNNLNTTAE